eukprot:4163084-Pyramimonas_sp.AAC.1
MPDMGRGARQAFRAADRQAAAVEGHWWASVQRHWPPPGSLPCFGKVATKRSQNMGETQPLQFPGASSRPQYSRAGVSTISSCRAR